MWIVRFESVNYRARIWLNGQLRRHARRRLPAVRAAPPARLPRAARACNRLVLRVDSRRTASDFPPAKFDARGRPLGGWWNYGGILREVYLRTIDDIDMTTVDVRPRPAVRHVRGDACAGRSASATPGPELAAGHRRRALRRAVACSSARVALGPEGDRRRSRARLSVARAAAVVAGPPVPLQRALRAIAGTRTLQTFTRRVGVRSIRVASDGRLRAQRARAERARRRAAGGLARPRIRDRQRHA